MDGQDSELLLSDSGDDTVHFMNRPVGWKFAIRALAGIYAVLVLAVVAFRGLLPGLVFGIVGIVVGVAVRRRLQRGNPVR